jgi:hypothetical protein
LVTGHFASVDIIFSKAVYDYFVQISWSNLSFKDKLIELIDLMSVISNGYRISFVGLQKKRLIQLSGTANRTGFAPAGRFA